MVHRVLQDIWEGSILFQSSMHKLHRTRNLTSEDLVTRSYGRRGPGVRYRYQDASLFKLSRLRVPRYRHIINMMSFCVLLVLYVLVLHNREKYFSNVECVFWLWGLGCVLDEIVAFNDAGFTLYVMSLWNMFDCIILVLITSYVVLRLMCFWFREHGDYDNYLWCTRTAFDLLAAGAIFLFPRLFSLLDNYQSISKMIISARRMIIDSTMAMVVIIACSSGFWVAFTMAFARDVFSAEQVAYDLLKIFFGFSPVVWNSWDYYSNIGRVVLVLYMFVCNFMIVTILIAVLAASFADITKNAHEEHRYQFAVNTITMIKSESSSLFAYAVPLNLLEWAIRPLYYVLPLRHFLILNRTVIKGTHFPILFSIFVYEKIHVRMTAKKEKRDNEALQERRKVLDQRQQELQRQQEQYAIMEEERKKQKLRKSQGPPLKGHSKTPTASSGRPNRAKKAAALKALTRGTGEVSTTNLQALNKQLSAMDQNIEPKVSNQDLLDEVFQRPYEGSLRGRPSFSVIPENPMGTRLASGAGGPGAGYGTMNSTMLGDTLFSPRRKVARLPSQGAGAGDDDFRWRRAQQNCEHHRKDSILSQAHYFYNTARRKPSGLEPDFAYNSDPEDFMKQGEGSEIGNGLKLLKSIPDLGGADDEADSEPDATDGPDDFSILNGGEPMRVEGRPSGSGIGSGIQYFSQFRNDGWPVQLPASPRVFGRSRNRKLKRAVQAQQQQQQAQQTKLGTISSREDSSEHKLTRTNKMKQLGPKDAQTDPQRGDVAAGNESESSRVTNTTSNTQLKIPTRRTYKRPSSARAAESSVIGAAAAAAGLDLSPAVSTISAFETYLIEHAGLKTSGSALMAKLVMEDEDGYTIKGKRRLRGRGRGRGTSEVETNEPDDDDDSNDDNEDQEDEGEEEDEDEEALSVSSETAEEIRSMTRMVIGRMDELESSVKTIENLLTALAASGVRPVS